MNHIFSLPESAHNAVQFSLTFGIERVHCDSARGDHVDIKGCTQIIYFPMDSHVFRQICCTIVFLDGSFVVGGCAEHSSFFVWIYVFYGRFAIRWCFSMVDVCCWRMHSN